MWFYFMSSCILTKDCEELKMNIVIIKQQLKMQKSITNKSTDKQML